MSSKNDKAAIEAVCKFYSYNDLAPTRPNQIAFNRSKLVLCIGDEEFPVGYVYECRSLAKPFQWYLASDDFAPYAKGSASKLSSAERRMKRHVVKHLLLRYRKSK
jgi:hypothetical protein